MGTTQARAWRKETTWCLGTGCVSKEVTEDESENEARPDGEEL